MPIVEGVVIDAQQLASSPPVATIRAVVAADTAEGGGGYFSKLADLARTSVLPRGPRESDRCHQCGREDTALARVTSYASQLERCRVCGTRLCGKCLVRPKHLQIPPELLHPDFARPTPSSASSATPSVNARTAERETATAAQPVAKAVATSVYLCAPAVGPCEARVRAAMMESLRARHARDCDLPLAEYFLGGERQLFLHPKPADADADTPERRQQRRLQVDRSHVNPFSPPPLILTLSTGTCTGGRGGAGQRCRLQVRLASFTPLPPTPFPCSHSYRASVAMDW